MILFCFGRLEQTSNNALMNDMIDEEEEHDCYDWGEVQLYKV